MELTAGTLTSIAAFILIHSGSLIYWMSKINTTLSFVVKRLDEHENHKYSSIDAARDFQLRDQQIKAIFNKMDKLEK